jgi:hypothetical protein
MTQPGDNRSVHIMDIKADLAALRAALSALRIADHDRMHDALLDAEQHAAAAEPDRKHICGALARVLNLAKGANDVAGHMETLKPYVTPLAQWLGSEGHTLTLMVGLGG